MFGYPPHRGMLRAYPGEAQAPTRPNVIFIFADDMRKDDFEYMPQTRQFLTEQGMTLKRRS